MKQGKRKTNAFRKLLCTYKQQPYYNVNKILLKKLGLDLAVLIDDLLDQFIYFHKKQQLVQFIKNDDFYFFSTFERIERDTGFKRTKQQKLIKKLEEMNLIITTRKGIPPKRYIAIKVNQLTRIMQNVLPETGNSYNRNTYLKVPTPIVSEETPLAVISPLFSTKKTKKRKRKVILEKKHRLFTSKGELIIDSVEDYYLLFMKVLDRVEKEKAEKPREFLLWANRWKNSTKFKLIIRVIQYLYNLRGKYKNDLEILFLDYITCVYIAYGKKQQLNINFLSPTEAIKFEFEEGYIKQIEENLQCSYWQKEDIGNNITDEKGNPIETTGFSEIDDLFGLN